MQTNVLLSAHFVDHRRIAKKKFLKVSFSFFFFDSFLHKERTSGEGRNL